MPTEADLYLPHVAKRLTQRDTLTVVAFGSSSTLGVGASGPQAAYPSLLAASLGRLAPVRMLNRGIAGEDSDDMVGRIDRDVIAVHPDLVIWQTGSNDSLRKVPIDRFVRETIFGIDRMKTAHIDVMLMEPQFCPTLESSPGASLYRTTLRALAGKLHVPIVRRYDLMRAWLASGSISAAELISRDGLHMADKGYARLASEVASEILADAHIVAADKMMTRATRAATR